MANILRRPPNEGEPDVEGAQTGYTGYAVGLAPGPNKRGDYDVAAATQILNQEIPNILGRAPEEGMVASILQGQGLKPGDRFVGYKNLQSVLNTIGQSPEAQAYLNRSNPPPVANPAPELTPWDDTTGMGPGGIGEGDFSSGFQYPFGSGDFIFDDPGTALFESILKGRLENLMKPLNIQGLSQFQGLLNSRIGELQSPLNIPELSRYKQALSTRSGELQGPAPVNEQLQRVLQYASERMSELQGPPFTALQEKGQEVKAFDQLEQDRQAAIRQVTERLGARGIGAGSGILEAAVQQTSRAFDQLKSQRTNDLLMYRTEEGQRRRGEALEVGTLASGLRQSEIDVAEARKRDALQVLGELSRSGQAETLMNEGRRDSVVNLAGMLADMGINVATLEDARGREAVTTAALLPELLERRLGLALGASSGSMGSFGSQLAGFLGQAGANRSNFPMTNSSGTWQGIGQLLGLLGPSLFGGGSNGG